MKYMKKITDGHQTKSAIKTTDLASFIQADKDNTKRRQK